jgi:hypothetical protein
VIGVSWKDHQVILDFGLAKVSLSVAEAATFVTNLRNGDSTTSSGHTLPSACEIGDTVIDFVTRSASGNTCVWVGQVEDYEYTQTLDLVAKCKNVYVARLAPTDRDALIGQLTKGGKK